MWKDISKIASAVIITALATLLFSGCVFGNKYVSKQEFNDYKDREDIVTTLMFNKVEENLRDIKDRLVRIEEAIQGVKLVQRNLP